MPFLSERSFGLGIDPLDSPTEVINLVRTAEDLGYESVWIADSPLLWREAHVLIARAAAVTRKIVIGTGVTNPQIRHASVIAGMYATMDELTPGRIAIGIGRGDSSVYLTGLAPATTAELEQSVRDLKGLLSGETVAMGTTQGHMAFPRPVPVLLSATGPKTLRVAARVADGAILGFLTQPAQITAARAEIETEAAKCGRDLSEFLYIGWIWCCVDDDLDVARRAVKVHVARHLLHASARPADTPLELVERVRQAYQYSEHMHPEAGHAELVPADIVDRCAIVGNSERVRQRIADLLDAGLDHLVLIPGGDHATYLRSVTRLATEVFPQLRQGKPA